LENHFKNFPKIQGVSQNARTQMANTAYSTLKALCQKKRELEGAAQALLLKAKSSSEADNGGCNAFNSNSSQFQGVSAKAKAYGEALGNANVSYNRDFDRLIKQESQDIRNHGKSQQLEKAHEQAWGLNLNGVAANSRLEDGFFSKIIPQIQNERKDIEKYLDPQKTQTELITQSGLTCGSLGKPDQGADDKLKAGGHNTDGDSAAPPAGGDTAKNGGDNPAGTNGGDANTPEAAPAETPTQSGGVGSWVSNHKGALLVGAGAAAVVGGVLLYKHNQDKKKEDAQDLEIGALDGMVSGPGSSVSTGTSATTQTVLAPADSTLQVAGFPTEATVGVPIGPITVRVIGADGAALSDGGIEVTLSCTSDCGLGGTLTKTTVGGQAQFGGISFSRAGSGVQLRVSSPGINSVASPGSFPVREAAN
jgi:hypothetical protein